MKIGSLLLAAAMFAAIAIAVANSPANAATKNIEALEPLGDTALRGFVDRTVSANLEVRAARAKMKAGARRAEAAAKPLYNPEIEYESKNAEASSRTIELAMDIDWSGKRKARSRVGSAESLVDRANYSATVQGIAVGLLEAMAEHQIWREIQRLATTSSDIMSNFRSQAERRAQIGDINRMELDLAIQAAAQAKLEQASAAGRQAIGVQNVRAFGVATAVVEWPDLGEHLPQLSIRADQLQQFVQQLPDIRAQKAMTDAASAQVAVARKDRRPDPTIAIRGGEDNDESLVGFRFSIPLFVRNNFDRELAAAIAEDSAAENTLQNSIRIAEARLAAALESYNLFAGAWLEWEQTGVGSIGRQAEVLEVLYAAGEISASEFLVQTRQTVVARTTAMELRLDLWRSWLEVLAASGLANRWLSLSEDPL